VDVREIGKRINELREKKYPSRASFAAVLHTSEGNIKRIEQGKGLPSLELLIKMVSALEVTPDYILFGNVVSDEDNTKFNLNLILNQLSPAGKNALLNIANEIHKLENGIT